MLIESALWDPANIAQTGRKLGVVTDARYRSSAASIPNSAFPAVTWRRSFVTKICGGEPSP